MIKFVKKFNYQSVPRVTVEGRRYYATPDGNRLPSVTTILDRTKSEESKQALQNWRARVGTEAAQAITTEAANRGTRMHTYLEQYVRDGVIKDRGTNPFSWASHAMAHTVVEHGLKNVSEFWGIEVPLYFPRGICRHNRWCRHTLKRRSHLRLQANQQAQTARVD
jgi:hypothetical protein